MIAELLGLRSAAPIVHYRIPLSRALLCANTVETVTGIVRCDTIYLGDQCPACGSKEAVVVEKVVNRTPEPPPTPPAAEPVKGRKPRVSLTPAQEKEALALFKTGEYSQAQIAETYGVSQSSMSRLVRGVKK
jgi:predicted DNA-binding protein (UPF0251 family)